MRKELADKWIRGRGIECGGLHFPLPVPPGALVAYVDRMSLEDLKRTSDVKPVENEIIVDDAEHLRTIGLRSQDFIIANHVLEHCRDPIGTLRTWSSRLRNGGILYCALPEKTHTFDKPRAVTTIEHIRDDAEAAEWGETDDAAHYREWFSMIDGYAGDALDAKVAFSVAEKTNIHFHVWDLPAMDALFAEVSKLFEVVERCQNGAEVIWVLRARG